LPSPVDFIKNIFLQVAIEIALRTIVNPIIIGVLWALPVYNPDG
jgi:hypothetical protein